VQRPGLCVTSVEGYKLDSLAISVINLQVG